MKKHVIVLIIGIILLGFGCGYIGFELFDYNFVNTLPDNTFKYKEKTYTKTIELNKNYYIYNENGRVNINYDDTLGNQLIIKTSYAYDYLTLKVYESSEVNSYELYFNFNENVTNANIKDLFNAFKVNIKNKVLYDYSELYSPVVNVYVSRTYENNIIVNGNGVDITEDDGNLDINF